MKRTHSFFVIMALVAAALCFASCEETPPVVGEEQTIPGRWKCNFTTSDTPPEGVLFWIRKGDTITFRDFSYELVRSNGEVEEGKWQKIVSTLRFIPILQESFFDFLCDADNIYITLIYPTELNYLIRLDRLYTD
jgi:hypothetical protein